MFSTLAKKLLFRLEVLYSLALQRAETCKGGNSGGRELTPSPSTGGTRVGRCVCQPTRTDSLGLAQFPGHSGSVAKQCWGI